MSISHSFDDNRHQRDNSGDRQLMSPREQILGHIILILICLLAILLRSM